MRMPEDKAACQKYNLEGISIKDELEYVEERCVKCQSKSAYV